MIRSFLTKHAFGILWSQSANRVVRLLSAFLVFRVLDEADASRFMWLLAAALVGSILSDFGLRNTVYAEVGRLEGDSLKAYVSKVYTSKLILSLLVLLLLPVFVHYVQGENWAVSVLGGIMTVTLYVSDPGVQVLRGRVLGHLELAIFLVDGVLLLSVMLVLWLCEADSLILVVGAWSSIGAARVLLTYSFVRKHVTKIGLCASKKDLMEFFVDKIAPGLVLLIFIFQLRFPALVAPYVGLGRYTGVIALILMVLQSFQIVPAVVSNVMIPMAHRKERSTEISTLVRPTLFANLAAGLVAAALVFFAAEVILRLAGEEYPEHGNLLRMAVIAVPFICANQMLRLLAIAGGIGGHLVARMAGAVCLAVALVVALSSVWGAMGAMAGYVLSELILSAVLGSLVRRKLTL